MASWTAIELSAKLAWKNLLFPFINPLACLLPGLVYALSAWPATKHSRRVAR